MLGFVPHELKLLRLGTRYSNFKPRDPVEFRQGDSEKYKEHIEKLGSMHHNGIEAFPLFAATIVSDVVVPQKTHLANPTRPRHAARRQRRPPPYPLPQLVRSDLHPLASRIQHRLLHPGRVLHR